MMRFIFALLLISTGANAATNTLVTSAPPVQGLVSATDTSAGVADAAKVPLLNPLGYIDLTMLAALSGDCMTPGGSGVLTCTKTNGVAFGVGATATVIPPAWLGTTSTTALAGNTAFVPLSAVYPVESYGAVCDGSTDDSVAVQAAITAAQSTGGTVLFPSKTCRINSQLSIPNDGASTLAHQRPIRLQGFGSHMNGSGAQAPYGGTVLDLRSSAVDGKLVSYGLGLLEIRDITFYDGGTNTNPYLFATNTTVHIYDNAFIGNPPKSGTTCDQDAIVLGGTAHTFGNTPADSFQGYGTVISHNAFDRIRRAIYFKVDTNANVIEGNTVYSNSGTALAGGAAIDLDGGVYTSTGNYIAGNLIEVPHYVYGIKLANGSANTIVGNDCFDAGGSTVACVRIETTSTRNLITGSLAGGVPAIYLSAASSNTGGNEYLSTDQGHPSYLGPANTFDDAGNQPWTFANVAFQGGDTKTTIQPSATQTQGQIQLQLKRSAAEGSSPSGKVFELDYNGDTKWFSGASVQNGSFTSTGTTWTSASGNLTLTPSSAVVDTGRFSIGGSGNTNAAFSLVNGPTSSQPVWISANGTLDSTLTNTFTGVAVNPSTAASSFNVGLMRNYYSAFNVLGAASSVTTIIGYDIDPTLVNAGATNTFGLRSNIASGSGRYNIYAIGTAQNLFAGEVKTSSDFWVNGTAGAGYLELDTQSSTPATPPTNDIRLYSDASGRFAWIGSNGFTRVFDGTANTANRVYTLPDVAGTMLNTGNVPNILTTAGALKGSSGTISQAACADLSNGATGCSTATGTSGATLPLLNGANTWSGVQSINSGDLALKGATSGTLTVNAAAAAGTNTLTLPAGTTDFTATGAASNVVQQSSLGGALTVGRLACADLSNAAASCSTDATVATNITSGTLPAGRLPNPSATTLGGVESFAAVSNQWINTISTSGVPSATQPAASNLSNGTTGTAGSAVVLATSPTIAGPTLTGTVNISSTLSTNANTVVLFSGAVRVKRVAIADANYAMGSTDGTIFAYTSISAARTITFAFNGTAQLYIFKDESGSAGATNTISLSGPTIDGAASPQVIINAAFGVRILYCTSSTICFKVL